MPDTDALATLVHTVGRVWCAISADDKHLLTITGHEDSILGPATASLVADHGYPIGEWSSVGPGRYQYHAH